VKVIVLVAALATAGGYAGALCGRGPALGPPLRPAPPRLQPLIAHIEAATLRACGAAPDPAELERAPAYRSCVDGVFDQALVRLKAPVTAVM
jgi:hypothetical protein